MGWLIALIDAFEPKWPDSIKHITLNSDWNAQTGSFLHYNTVFDQADKTGDYIYCGFTVHV